MSEKNIFEGNRAAWNEAMGYHQKARNGSLQNKFKDPDFTTLNRACDQKLQKKLKEIDFTGKTISHIPCNNGRELLSLMKLGAKEGIGFDISDAAIAEAEELAEISKRNAKFVRTNVMDIGPEYNDSFDFIFISQGSLQWFPDLEAYFSVIARLLKKGGTVIISEIHPFKYFFENGFRFQKQNFDRLTSYFEKGPHNYPTGLDYIGNVEYDASECFWFMHKMSDIITALLHNGIEIEDFEEFQNDMDGDADPLVLGKFPFSYLITAKKK